MSRMTVLCRIRPSGNSKDCALRVSAESDRGGVGNQSSNRADRATNNASSILNVISVPSVDYSTKLDTVFNESTSQEQVFSHVVPQLVTDLFKGYNCTLFVYGQTGSGKTFTIQGNDANKGIVSRLSQMLFDSRIDSDQNSTSIKLSLLEIYQEKLKDLLSPNTSSTLKIRESQEIGIWIEGLFEQTVTNSQQFDQHVINSLARRSVGSTNMNQESSRSHLCYMITVTQRPLASSSGSQAGRSLFSKMCLVDLAGSEVVRKTDASGARLNEAKYINKSLSALGNVIYALSLATSNSGVGNSSLVNNNNNNNNNNSSGSSSISNSNNKENIGASKKSLHIPYRDSKLTRILQDSLGGNAKTVLILTVSDSHEHLAETLATLRFGDRAKMVSTRPKVNEELDEANLRNALGLAKRRIDTLSSTILDLEKQLSGRAFSSSSGSILGEAGSFDPSKPCPTCGACNLTLTNSFTSLSVKKVNSSSSISSRGPSPLTVSNDIVDKCAVCGLGESDTLRLSEEIGMNLGEFVICDGNCGNRFHETCVGGINQNQSGDDSGVRGEWFCLQCTDFSPDNTISSANIEKLIKNVSNSSSFNNSSNVSECDTQADRAMVVKLTTEYHTMRKERNRVLSQWRLERQMQSALDNRRKALDFGREKELVRLQQEVDRLSAENSIINMKLLDRQSKTIGTIGEKVHKKLPGLSRSSFDEDIPNSILKLSSSSSSVSDFESPFLSPIINDYNRRHPKGGSSPPTPLTVGENLLKDYNQDILQRLSRHLDLSPPVAASNSNSSPNSATILNPSTSIPKTWKSKPKKIRLETETVSSLSPSLVLNSLDGSDVEANPSFSYTSPISNQRSNHTGAVHRSLSGPISNHNNINPIGISHSLSLTHISVDSSSEELNGAGSNHPFSLRLRELIKSVKAETGDFQEIRSRFQSRDVERQQLQSSRHERFKPL
jgi:hypothetical protein